ncbi:uncharacterized protein BKA78DRAFT_307790 [Phyllosticta capitalensis]|uniref:uncharacterized protein n=1 Tax=Phyllosticta capitalensis TaxID=121624 RepID=UPI00312D81EA
MAGVVVLNSIPRRPGITTTYHAPTPALPGASTSHGKAPHTIKVAGDYQRNPSPNIWGIKKLAGRIGSLRPSLLLPPDLTTNSEELTHRSWEPTQSVAAQFSTYCASIWPAASGASTCALPGGVSYRRLVERPSRHAEMVYYLMLFADTALGSAGRASARLASEKIQAAHPQSRGLRMRVLSSGLGLYTARVCPSACNPTLDFADFSPSKFKQSVPVLLCYNNCSAPGSGSVGIPALGIRWLLAT